ncbi:hypothetical protein [Streptomyces sp. CAU 1734]|uniref:helix-turn-helix transcriptional regulator n=1 Tax=Streptomyces sp. CAU 1734 TaxID=3140360 RepID=UPI003260BD6A
MKNIEEVREAFKALPEFVTGKEIAAATGRAHIQNWVGDPTFPKVRREGRTGYWPRDEVLAWYASKGFAGTNRSGPRGLKQKILAAEPNLVLMDSSALADLLDLTRRAVNKYAERFAPRAVADPFPPADHDGKRSWSQVRGWWLRKDDPMPQTDTGEAPSWADRRAWLLRHASDGNEPRADGTVYLDELGLTVGQRDAIERARVMRSSGAPVSTEWLSEVLHLTDPEQEEWLNEFLDLQNAGLAALRVGSASPARESRRMGVTALARELGISPVSIKHFARVYTPDLKDDPFPAKDESKTRDVAEVRDWLIRNRKIQLGEGASTEGTASGS